MPLIVYDWLLEGLARWHGNSRIQRLRPYSVGVSLAECYAEAWSRVNSYFTVSGAEFRLYFVMPPHSPLVLHPGLLNMVKLGYKREHAVEYREGVGSYVTYGNRNIYLLNVWSIRWSVLDTWFNMHNKHLNIGSRIAPEDDKYLILPRLLPTLLF